MVANSGSSCEAADNEDDLEAKRGHPRALRRRDFVGEPDGRAVIVLTVKPFGETLEAPRTVAVWLSNGSFGV
jgi:hypothetical protein